MTTDLFGLSPMSTLSASIRGGLAPGQLGMVMARAGVGKSAFLVHIALGHLLRGTEVLHVSLHITSGVLLCVLSVFISGFSFLDGGL